MNLNVKVHNGVYCISAINTTCQSITLYFICNKNSVLSGRHVPIIIRSSSGPLIKQIQELFTFQCIVGSHNALKYK